MAAYSIRCPVCRQKMPWNEADGFPSKCFNPECGHGIGNNRDNDDVVIPWIRTNQRTVAIDKVYRDMERGSEIRAQAAADMLGVPVAEMSALKITDMHDNQRPGDVADKPQVSTEMRSFMQENPQGPAQVGFGQGAAAGLHFSQFTSQGKYPNAGRRMQDIIRNDHPSNVLKHCVGVDAYTRQPVRPRTDVMSEIPANEVLTRRRR